VLMYVQEEEPAPAASDGARGDGLTLAGVAVMIPAILTLVLGVFPEVLFGVLRSAAAVRF
jgi:NADH:ubiquinone oxidoreductase subunit 2 (subunit N)